MDNQVKIEKALTDAIKELDFKILRKAKADMFRCSAQCCEGPYQSIEENQSCQEDCARKILKIQKLVQDEFINFQERLDRAAKSCQDDYRDQITSETTKAQRAKYQLDVESCITNHINEHVLKLPKLINKLITEGKRIQNE